MSGISRASVSIHDIDLEKLGPNSPLRELAARRRRSPPSDEEHQEQVQLIEWASGQEHQFPALRLLFAIPNFAGFHGSKGARKLSGARAKAEGRKPGVPDLCLPVARGPYHGLFIELKPIGRYANELQRRWITDLRAEGYHALVCKGWESARRAITDYLVLPASDSRPDGGASQ